MKEKSRRISMVEEEKYYRHRFKPPEQLIFVSNGFIL
jgi:hypothetical protein